MVIKHKIISFNANTGSIEVLYYTDDFQEGLVYNIDIPINNSVYASKDEIEELINLFAPKGQVERAITLKNTETPAYIAEMVEPLEPISLISDPIITGVDPLPTE